MLRQSRMSINVWRSERTICAVLWITPLSKRDGGCLASTEPMIVVFHFCGSVDDVCYYHEKESRGYFSVNAPHFDSTSCSGDNCYTVFSIQLYVYEVLANHGRSCDKTNVVRCIVIITVLSATIPVEMSTKESRSLYPKGEWACNHWTHVP